MDLADPDLYTSSDRHRRWDEWASADAVTWTGPGHTPAGFWSVFSHRSCAKVLGPKAPFTSERGMMLGFDAQHPDHAGGKMIVVTDGEWHHHLRRMIGPFLSRLKADTLAEFVRREADELLDKITGPGPVELARNVGPRLPAAVVCEILGIPAEDREFLIALTRDAFGETAAGGNAMSAGEAHGEIMLYFEDLIEYRRHTPGDDLLSALLADEQMTDEDVLINCDNVVVGGNETTRHSITAALHAVAVTPGLLDSLAQDPGLIPVAVDEVVRWSSPAMHVLRVATADIEIGDKVIRKDDAVAVWLASANRDPVKHERPHEVRLDRPAGKHLGFGHGAHHCLGAAMTRLELQSLFEVMVKRIRDVAVAAEPQWLRSNIIQGYRELKVDLSWK
ncbi:cytochrome P450 [Kibdelosporangium aridum]|uniref:cytochrome P450 n=1 Tax=Kibdelosporangium aridum TaxID=2030 RepID=UPI000AC04573|nr:cytochrome P450 [Kibdelosporangium aridum]